jgi:protein-S-isoprenylcysteine O-methyltransferase Ste14
MEPSEQKTTPGLAVHKILANAYLLYLAAVILGFSIDVLFPLVLPVPFAQPIGLALIALGTGVIYWAQHTSGKTAAVRHDDSQDLTADHFTKGPYYITRIPTLYGLTLMTIGLGFLFMSPVMVAIPFIAFLIVRLVLVPKEEEYLVCRYGQAYLDYKKTVRL